jgi:predicted ATP-binding protein involved in virulence
MKVLIVKTISMANKSKSKELILKNVGPFDEKGLKIRFHEKEKVDNKKANIHILVGENGSGKSTILRTLFYASYSGDRNQIDNSAFSKLNPDDPQWGLFSDWRNVFYYTPNEWSYIESVLDPHIMVGDHTKQIRYPRSINMDFSPIHRWYSEYDFDGYYKFIFDFVPKDQANLNKDELFWMSFIHTFIIKIQHFFRKVYDKKLLIELDSENEVLRYVIDGKQIKKSELSNGYFNLLGFTIDVFISILSSLDYEKVFDFDKIPFTLLLDEIDNHLHPKAQRSILPALQELFPNAEIFCTTHSPFVVNSVSDAWVYELSEENYTIEKDGLRVLEGKKTSILNDYETVLINNFNYGDDFGGDAVDQLNNLHSLIKAENKDLQKIREIVDKVRESENVSLIKKVEFELLQNNIDM